MFEFYDERLGGPVGLLKVTDARANFAEILKSEKKLVITRHGRPTKILVDYDEYLALLEKAGGKNANWEKSKEKAVA
ncbi:MAG: type II toxin-antitoxin system Phd/YefM family antitoxin [Deltaproteobacteria bacterium]|nr:type II toxin-antitoxin system Phd/YefM family antitoxin [Deltaproteobacteria bacterium]